VFDIVSVTQEFNVVDYQAITSQVIKDIFKRGKIPILVGGSGMYAHALLYGYRFAKQALNEKLPEEVKELQKLLEAKAFDLNQLNQSDRNNPRRLQNYLRKILAGHKPQSLVNLQKHKKPLYDYDLHLMEIDLSNLKIKLEQRVDKMIKQGFIQEVELLLEIDKSKTIAKQIKNASGYKQVIQYISEGRKLSIEQLKQKIVTSHYQLAKRQITWNKKYFR
jgi:tRNA dimethylallyltransferase